MISRSATRRAARWPRIGLALSFLALAWPASADTFRVKTARGTYLVEVDAADITVSGDGDDLVIKPAKGDEVRLKLDSDRSERSAKEPFLAIRRDGKVIVSARRISSASETPAEEVAGRTPLGEGNLGPAWSVAIAPDGVTMLTGHQGMLRVWDLPIRAQRSALPTGRTVRRVALTPDAATFASAEYSFVDGKAMGQVVIRDGKTGEARREMGPVEALHGVAIDPAAKLAVSSSWGNADLLVWDVPTGRKLRTLKGHSGYVGAVVFSPDGKSLASGGDDSVRLWDVEKGVARATLRGHKKGVESVAFSGDGRRLASGSFDDTAKVWDVATGRLLATLECDEPVLAVAASADGKLVATAAARWGGGFYDQAPAEVRVWDVAAGRATITLPEQPGQVFGLAFTPDGKSLVTAGLSGVVAVWELARFGEDKGPARAEKAREP